VTRRLAITACLVLAPASAGASPARPAVSLVASPAHVSLAGSARQLVKLTNSGSRPVVVEVTRARYGLDLRGRPRVLRSVAPWIRVRPRRLRIAPAHSARLAVVSRPPRRAQPGDHSQLVLLTTRPVHSGALSVRMRLGVVVVVRVRGRIVRRLAVLRVRLRPRRLDILVANRGNVTETVSRRCGLVTVRRGGRVLARIRPPDRQLLPHTRGVLELRYRRPVAGRLRVAVALATGPPCRAAPSRSFSVRLRR
jgi:hypothetical protein